MRSVKTPKRENKTHKTFHSEAGFEQGGKEKRNIYRSEEGSKARRRSRRGHEGGMGQKVRKSAVALSLLGRGLCGLERGKGGHDCGG